MRALLTCFTAAALTLFAAVATAQQQLSIVTSLPKDLTEVYKRAFEARNPGTKVEVLYYAPSSP